MDIPTSRCQNCNKTFKLGEGILRNGKSFCSEQCEKEYLNVKA